jgi:hypothetical protein
MIVACDASGCVRGLVHRDGGWADPCKVCGGTGGVPLGTLCKRIGEHESTVRKILKPGRRMRPRVTARIMGKILDVVAVR